MGKKHKNQLKKRKIENKTNSFPGKRKQRYLEMALKGELGSNELMKYRDTYNTITKIAREHNLPSVDGKTIPKRSDYNSLRELYRGQI